MHQTRITSRQHETTRVRPQDQVEQEVHPRPVGWRRWAATTIRPRGPTSQMPKVAQPTQKGRTLQPLSTGTPPVIFWQRRADRSRPRPDGREWPRSYFCFEGTVVD